MGSIAAQRRVRAAVGEAQGIVDSSQQRLITQIHLKGLVTMR